MLGETFKELRVKSGLTQSQVGIQLGVSRQVVSNWECGVTQIPGDMFIPLSQLFHCSPSAFVKLDKHSFEWYVQNYLPQKGGLEEFAIANPDLMRIILWMVNEWDGNFAMLVTMAYYYCLLSKGDRSHISYLTGVMFKEKYDHPPIEDELIKLGLNRLPDYVEEWEKLSRSVLGG